MDETTSGLLRSERGNEMNMLRSFLLAAVAVIVLIVGCDVSAKRPPSSEAAPAMTESTTEASPDPQGSQPAGRVIVSSEAITVENGKVTYGRPKVTDDVERQIYRTLSYHRNLANEIEKQVPGGNRGSQQSRQDYERTAKSYMAQYNLSETDIASILSKGDEQGWK